MTDRLGAHHELAETVPWLAPAAILRVGLLSTLPAGSVLLRAGECTEQVFILVEGMVEEVTAGRTRHLDTPGRLLATSGLIEGAPSLATLRAESRSVVVAVATRFLRESADPVVLYWLALQMASGRHTAFEDPA